MFFRKEKEKQVKPQKLYKATYKSLHSGKEIVLKTSAPARMLNSFINKDKDEYEVYMLSYVTTLDEVN